MQPVFDGFGDLFGALRSCKMCRDEILAIRELPESSFKFHWNPYLRPKSYQKEPPPLGYIFLGWEPAWPSPSDLWDEVGEGSFNTPLQFAIRQFLIAEQPETGFLITNMAQCSIRTGPICDSTRDGRFKTCNHFLKQQFLLAGAGANDACLVSLGWKPKRFLESHTDLYGAAIGGQRTIHHITHYSRQCNQNFHKFAEDKRQEFETFKHEFRSSYEQFIQNGEFSSDWKRYSQTPTNSDRDLERLFKWQYEMRETNE